MPWPLHKRRPDPLPPPEVRAVSAMLAAGRIAIGAGLAVAPQTTLSMLGFRDAGPTAITISRVAGGRDLALGLAALLALRDRERLRAADVAMAAVDAGDVLSFAAALRHGAETRRAALRGVAAAAPASLAGLWAAMRLR